MPPDPPTAPGDPLDPAAWGIDDGYHDVAGTWHPTSPATARALVAAMGGDADHPRPPAPGSLRVVRAGGAAAVDGAAALVLEDGTERVLDATGLPGDLPLGRHRALDRAGDPIATVLVAPPRIEPPADRAWGVTALLDVARSSRSWGVGDLDDLALLIDWTQGRGGTVVGLNPLHAPDPGPHPLDSPYSPSSRRWHNPLHLAIQHVPGAAGLPHLDRLAAEARALHDGRLVDRAAAWSAKRAALEALWAGFGGDAAFDAFRVERGEGLYRWATYCALVDHLGGPWPRWPAELRHPGGPAVARFAAAHPNQLAFWSWLQWLLDDQLAASGAPDALLADLAVGFAPDGFDAWDWQDLLAPGCRIGAPPDLLGPDGQDWGLPPFVPWRLREVAYRPIEETIAAVARHATGLRIDHVMGLFRLFWLPPGGGAVDGAYVGWPGDELLAAVLLACHRAGVHVVGEDLGTVEDGVREALAAAGVSSTRLLWFEDRPPAEWPVAAQAAVTTHDLPTVAGVWTGTDLADQRAAGVTASVEADALLRHHLRVAGSCDDAAPVDHVAGAAHRAVGSSPAALATATIDDLLGAEHRPNLPGTIDEHPNWRLPLPALLDDLAAHPRAEAIAAALSETRPA